MCMLLLSNRLSMLVHTFFGVDVTRLAWHATADQKSCADAIVVHSMPYIEYGADIGNNGNNTIWPTSQVKDREIAAMSRQVEDHEEQLRNLESELDTTQKELHQLASQEEGLPEAMRQTRTLNKHLTDVKQAREDLMAQVPFCSAGPAHPACRATQLLDPSQQCRLHCAAATANTGLAALQTFDSFQSR